MRKSGDILAGRKGSAVDAYLRDAALSKKLSPVKTAAGGSAQLWLCLSEALWKPRIRQQIARETFDQRTIAALARLAKNWVAINEGIGLNVCGAQYRVGHRAGQHAWLQIMEWEGGQIPRSALRYMTAYKSTLAPRFDLTVKGMDGISLIGEREAAIVSTRLLDEALALARCTPAGSFRVRLPEFIGLSSLGVSSLRVWITGDDGMWVGAEKDGSPGFSFLWTVKRPHFQRWVVPLAWMPTLHLTLSALWRDLRVGGEKLMRRDRSETQENGGANPDTRKVKFYGEIGWGSQDELERLAGEIYRVRGHIRRLPRGKRATWKARRQARDAGVILAKGMTFVRPYLKGREEGDDFSIPIHAQGLGQLVMAELGMQKAVIAFRLG